MGAAEKNQYTSVSLASCCQLFGTVKAAEQLSLNLDIFSRPK
jgi:hypothetical protein